MSKKVALLVVDMQKAFFEDNDASQSLNSALEYINYSIGKFREAEQLVIFIADEEAGGGIESEAYQLYEKLEFSTNDVLISKKYCNSFWNTELENVLKLQEIELVVICGFAAEYCIYNTYNGAIERGFDAVLLQNGVASKNVNYVRMIENICNITSYTVLDYLIF